MGAFVKNDCLIFVSVHYELSALFAPCFEGKYALLGGKGSCCIFAVRVKVQDLRIFMCFFFFQI